MISSVYRENLFAFMTKDRRTARSNVTVQVSSSIDASLLDNIDALLASGDTNAALTIIDLVTNGLNDGSEVDPALKTFLFGQ